MTSTGASAPPDMSERSDREIPRWRLHVLRAIALLFVVSGFFSYPQMLIHASATDRGMIKAFLTGLWLMSFSAVRFPLKMLPVFLFEFVWKTVWLLVFGLPQWITGVGSPRLSQDLLEIGSPPILLAFVIPWGYVWRHYFKPRLELAVSEVLVPVDRTRQPSLDAQRLLRGTGFMGSDPNPPIAKVRNRATKMRHQWYAC